MKFRLSVGVTAVVAAVATVTACTSNSSPPSGSGSSPGGASAGQLTVAIGANPPSFDPAAQSSSSSMQIENMIVETLTRVGATGTVEPLLATSWRASANGLAWTFMLRSGVKFSDGEQFNATAVKFSLDRLLSPKTYDADVNVLSVIKSVNVVSPTEVTINLSSPYAALPSALSFAAAGIYAPKSATQAPNTTAKITKPIGTGPYEFTSYTPNSSVVLTANASYWGPKPAFKTQVFKIVPDPASQQALLESGGAQIITDPEPSDIDSLKSNPSYSVSFGDTSYVIQIVINTLSSYAPKLRNPMVREALNYAVDRNAIISKILFGAGKIVTGPLSSLEFGACDVGSPYNYDPAKAKQLLAAAGASGITVRMSSSNGRYPGDYQVAQAVAGYLRAVGVHVKLANPTDYPTYLASVFVAPGKATTDLSLDGWSTYFPDASQGLLEFKSGYWPPSGYNQSYWQNPTYNSLYVKGNTSSSPATREQAYCQAQKIVWHAAPSIWLYQLRSPLVTTSKITGVSIRSDSEINTIYARSTG
jgi:peptide/nickel transport system substrate-binding protein